MACSAAKGRKRCQSAKHGHRRQRPDRLEKVLALFRCRAADCAAEARQLSATCSDRFPSRTVHATDFPCILIIVMVQSLLGTFVTATWSRRLIRRQPFPVQQVAVDFDSTLVESDICALFLTTASTQTSVSQLLAHSFRPNGGCHPSALIAGLARSCLGHSLSRPGRDLPLLSLLDATLTRHFIGVDSKRLMKYVSSLDATLTKTRGWRATGRAPVVSKLQSGS